MANPRPEGEHESDTIIARMEAQFHEDRGPDAHTDAEIREVWEYNNHVRAFKDGRYVDALNLGEAVGAPETGPRWSYRVHKSGGEIPVVPYSRYLLARVREKEHSNPRPSRPSKKHEFVTRWVERVEASAQSRFRLDLEYALQRLSLLFAGDQGLIWLESYNHSLGGRPIDVLRESGPAAVIEALDREEKGAF